MIVPTFLGIALLPHPHVGWRVLFAIGAVSVVLLAFCRPGIIPESPRWLMLHGRTGEGGPAVVPGGRCPGP